MGAWDHFYTDSAFDKDISTHYINLPHYFSINQGEKESFDLLKGQGEQHSSWTWMPVKEAFIHSQVHIMSASMHYGFQIIRRQIVEIPNF